MLWRQAQLHILQKMKKNLIPNKIIFVCVRYDSKASASESSAEGGDSDEDRKKKPAKKAKFVKERKPRKKEVRKREE